MVKMSDEGKKSFHHHHQHSLTGGSIWLKQQKKTPEKSQTAKGESEGKMQLKPKTDGIVEGGGG